MQLGLIGLARSGKTTLFNALTGQRLETGAGARPARTAVIKVPDPRVDQLADLFAPRKTTYAEVAFVDPGGEPAETAVDAPLPEAMAAALRGVDALVHVVRAFGDPSVSAAPGSTTPADDVRIIEEELILRDLAVVERRLERLRKERGKPENAVEQAQLEPVRAHLEVGRPLRDLRWGEAQLARMRGFQFLTAKPTLVVLNIDEVDLVRPHAVAGTGLESYPVLRLCAKVEREISELAPEEQREFLEHMGLDQPARAVFIRSAYELLQRVSFFTVGDDEVRAWPVRAGSTALVAAGKIHTDIQRGFIRAEAIHSEDFLRLGSMAAAKSHGLLRLEGKGYRVRDGDILHFRFGV